MREPLLQEGHEPSAPADGSGGREPAALKASAELSIPDVNSVVTGWQPSGSTADSALLHRADTSAAARKDSDNSSARLSDFLKMLKWVARTTTHKHTHPPVRSEVTRVTRPFLHLNLNPYPPPPPSEEQGDETLPCPPLPLWDWTTDVVEGQQQHGIGGGNNSPSSAYVLDSTRMAAVAVIPIHPHVAVAAGGRAGPAASGGRQQQQQAPPPRWCLPMPTPGPVDESEQQQPFLEPWGSSQSAGTVVVRMLLPHTGCMLLPRTERMLLPRTGCMLLPRTECMLLPHAGCMLLPHAGPMLLPRTE